MQALDVISVNLWHILISLANLAILFFILKRFLFKPVKRLFAERQATLDSAYAAAEEAERAALADKEEWEKRLESAEVRADAIIKEATDNAKYRATQIIDEADIKAEGIIRRAESEAELVRKKADESIRREIVDVSAAIAEKMLEREVNEDDHRAMIDSFIDRIGDDNGGDK
ncbi:MAG: F0F1 ATP synthase subunit B [Clostridia bacterium]|nr:F0F1 ATP synthase subunit B [Clostridia bacterium]